MGLVLLLSYAGCTYLTGSAPHPVKAAAPAAESPAEAQAVANDPKGASSAPTPKVTAGNAPAVAVPADEHTAPVAGPAAEVAVPKGTATKAAAVAKAPTATGSTAKVSAAPAAPAAAAAKAPTAIGSTAKVPAAPATANSNSPDKPAAALDLAGMEQRLKDTHAIGLFTKLSLKNQVDDLLGAVRAYHGGRAIPPLTDIRQRYDLLLLKVLTLLQDGDPPLASAISASREAIWGLLADRDKFQKIQMSQQEIPCANRHPLSS